MLDYPPSYFQETTQQINFNTNCLCSIYMSILIILGNILSSWIVLHMFNIPSIALFT